MPSYTHIIHYRLLVFFLFFFTLIEKQNAHNIAFQKDSTQVRKLIEVAKKNATNNVNQAVLDLKEALNLAIPLKDNKLILSVYRTQADIFESNNRLTEAYFFYEKALALQDSIPTSQKLDVFLDWAIINKKLARYTVARTYYQSILDLAFQAHDFEMVEFVYAGLGTLNSTLGEYDKAIECHLNAKETAQKRQNTEGVITAYVNMATVYTQTKNYKMAYSYLEKGNDLALSLKDSMRVACISNIYGKALTAEKRFSEAILQHQKALQFCEPIDNKLVVAQSLVLMADAYTQLKQYENAEKTFKKCLQYTNYFDYSELPNLYLLMGNFYLKTRRPSEAAVSFNKSLTLANERAFIDLIQKANRGLVDVYKQLGNSKRALEYMKIARIYEDSIFNKDKINRITEAQYKFDLTKAETEHKLSVAKSEKELQELSLNQNLIILCLMVVLLGAGMAFTYFFMKQKRKNNLILSQKNIEILSKNSRLEKSNEVLQQFAYASAHDLKEPLRSISGFVSIIDRKYAQLLPQESKEYMNFVVGGVKRMESLIAALLEYSTLASDDEDLEQATSIVQILQDVNSNLHSIILEKKAVVEHLGDLPSLKMSRLHLTQLLQNLIGNAVKFSDKKPLVQIKGRIERKQYILEIKDNGIGMDEEYSDKIFQLFQRLSRSVEGTGIGLAICKEIVNKYEGTIHFDSVKNVGTTFILSFPVKLIESDENEDITSSVKKEKMLEKAYY